MVTTNTAEMFDTEQEEGKASQEEKIKEVEHKSLAVVDQAKKITIRNNNQLIQAAEFLKDIKAALKEVGSTFDPIIEKTRAAWKEALAKKAKYADPLQAAEKLVKSKIGDYEFEKERARIAEEKRLREEALREEERQREKLEKKAEKAAANGNKDKARDLRQQARQTFVPTPEVPKETPKINGIGVGMDFEVVIRDVSLIPNEYVVKTANIAALKALAKATEGKAQVPGVEFRAKARISVTPGKPTVEEF